METYDYRKESETAYDVVAEVDTLTVKQLLRTHEAIQRIKEETDAESMEQGCDWFNHSILPILKGFAQIMGAVLEVQYETKGAILATLRSDCGFDISADYRLLYMALMASVHISIESNEDELALVLAYDPPCFTGYN